MASPDGAAVSDDAMGLTQRELLMEMREDIKGLKATVDVFAKDQALGLERRANMQLSADSILSRLDQHDRELDDLRPAMWTTPTSRSRRSRPRSRRA